MLTGNIIEAFFSNEWKIMGKETKQVDEEPEDNINGHFPIKIVFCCFNIY